jgi:hypothetical protein
VIQSLQELDSLLAGTALAGRTQCSLPVLDTDEVTLAVEVSPEELFEVWSIARQLVEKTGRWPVVTVYWGNESASWSEKLEGEDFFNRFGYANPPSDSDVSPGAILARSAKADALAFLQKQLQRDPDLLSDEHDTDQQETGAEHLDWFTPLRQTTALLFLPVAHGWESLAYLHWFGAGNDSEFFVALLRLWYERFGAELVAHYGTMLQFVVNRPPANLEEATELARQQVIAAPCTTMLAGVGLEHHARALIGLEKWCLHERP